jgi:hypothetical protein
MGRYYLPFFFFLANKLKISWRIDMPTPADKRMSVPTQEWDLRLLMGEDKEQLDYSAELMSVQIISNVASPYQVFMLVVRIDPIDTIFNELYGKTKVTLEIRKKSYEAIGTFTDELKFDLVQLNDKSALTQKGLLNRETNYTPVDVKMVMVPREPLKSMTDLVNAVYINASPRGVIESLANKYHLKIAYDKSDENTEKIPQVIIPPMTMYKAIKFVDDNFGLYKGVSNQGFCRYDNVLEIVNLSKRVKSGQMITIEHLTANSEVAEDYIHDSVHDATKFFCRYPLHTSYTGNTTLANIGNITEYNIKPLDSLYLNTSVDFTSLCKEYGLFAKGNKVGDPVIYHDDILSDRRAYRTDFVGGHGTESDVFLKSKLARSLVNMTAVDAVLDRNPRIVNLLKVGGAVQLLTQSTEYVDVAGMFILKTSVISFMRENVDWQYAATMRENVDWQCAATVHLSRTNKLMN